jgi:hypothetical protein
MSQQFFSGHHENAHWDIQSKLNLFFDKRGGWTQSVGPTNLTFEGGGDGAGVLVGVLLDDDAGVGGFSVDVGGDAAIGKACEMDI